MRTLHALKFKNIFFGILRKWYCYRRLKVLLSLLCVHSCVCVLHEYVCVRVLCVYEWVCVALWMCVCMSVCVPLSMCVCVLCEYMCVHVTMCVCSYKYRSTLPLTIHLFLVISGMPSEAAGWDHTSQDLLAWLRLSQLPLESDLQLDPHDRSAVVTEHF